ncbi:MAG TPA: polyprenol monophosphomannose synthase [Terracidiphilus sp.]|nr:polyprenol monophosphomannose synthase [Terracidiphilus sp.]
MALAIAGPSYMPMAAGTKPSREPAGLAADAPPYLGLVIPTLREAGNIGVLLGHVRAALEPMGVSYEILVVDDDSRDGTEQAVARIAGQDPRVRLIVRRGERGLAGAILDGWRRTEAPIVGVMDADLQHPPELLPDLLAAIVAGHDLAIGSRYAGGERLAGWSSMRRAVSKAAVWATLPLQGQRQAACDPMSGFFMVRRDCVENLAFQRSGFKLLLEILVRGRVRTVHEIPFCFGSRRAGSSKASLKVAWDYGRLLARLYLRRDGPWRHLSRRDVRRLKIRQEGADQQKCGNA